MSVSKFQTAESKDGQRGKGSVVQKEGKTKSRQRQMGHEAKNDKPCQELTKNNHKQILCSFITKYSATVNIAFLSPASGNVTFAFSGN